MDDKKGFSEKIPTEPVPKAVILVADLEIYGNFCQSHTSADFQHNNGPLA